MTDVVVTQEHTLGLIAALEAAEIVTGYAIGEDESGEDLHTPYAVVYPQPGELVGTLDAPESDAELVWRVVYVADSARGTEWLRDRGRQALLAGFDVEGRAIVRVTVDRVGEVDRDDDVAPPKFYCSESYRAWSSAG